MCIGLFFFSDHCIKQIDSMLPWVCSVIDHRGRQNVVKTTVTHSPAARVPLLCFYDILTSSVIYYWTDARQHGIYLLRVREPYLKYWFQTDLGRKDSTGFYMHLTFLTIVTRWSHSTSNFCALIGQNLTGEFMRNVYAASRNSFTDSWSWQSFGSSSFHVFNCVFPLDV